MNILFVCTGNTCRSPMAEGLAKHKFYGSIPDVSVSSRGLAVVPGSMVSINSVSVLKDRGIDISSHIPKSLSCDDVKNADLVLTMTAVHKEYITNVLPQYKDKVFSISEYTKVSDIADPYGQNEDEYRNCLNELENAINILYEKIKHE